MSTLRKSHALAPASLRGLSRRCGYERPVRNGWPSGPPQHRECHRASAGDAGPYGTDADLEETGDDEPTLGATENHPGVLGGGSQWDWYRFNLTTGEDEPSLGSSPNQTQWSAGYDRHQNSDGEREEENEHGGNVTDEPHDGVDDD